jgi:hypothetical protein
MRLLPFRFPHLINPILLFCNLFLANVRGACKGTQTHTHSITHQYTHSLSHTHLVFVTKVTKFMMNEVYRLERSLCTRLGQLKGSKFIRLSFYCLFVSGDHYSLSLYLFQIVDCFLLLDLSIFLG